MPDIFQEQKGFGTFLVADQINDLVNYSIDSKMPYLDRDRHYRATISEVKNNVADIKLLNDTNVIPDVKINSGLKLREDDQVYVLAINGNLNNLLIDSQVLDIDLLVNYETRNYDIIETFQDSSEWTPNHSIADDIIFKKYGKQSIRMTSVVSTPVDYIMSKTVSLDLSQYTDGESSPTSDLIHVSFYISDVDAVDLTIGCELYLKTDNSNYYYLAYEDFFQTLVQGWNNFSLSKDTFNEVGTGDWSDITEMQLKWTSNSGYEDEYMSFGIIVMFKPSEYTTAPLISFGTPSGPTASGTAGTLLYDGTYLYICYGTNQWGRIDHSWLS